MFRPGLSRPRYGLAVTGAGLASNSPGSTVIGTAIRHGVEYGRRAGGFTPRTVGIGSRGAGDNVASLLAPPLAMFGELAAAEEFALHEEETNAERRPERKAAIKKRRRER